MSLIARNLTRRLVLTNVRAFSGGDAGSGVGRVSLAH